jgi:hypothetical protein
MFQQFKNQINFRALVGTNTGLDIINALNNSVDGK